MVFSALPQDAENGSCGLCIPFRKAREKQRAWHRPRCMVWHSSTYIRYASTTTMGTESRPRCISPLIAYRSVSEAAGLLAPAECHPRPNLLDYPGESTAGDIGKRCRLKGVEETLANFLLDRQNACCMHSHQHL